MRHASTSHTTYQIHPYSVPSLDGNLHQLATNASAMGPLEVCANRLSCKYPTRMSQNCDSADGLASSLSNLMGAIFSNPTQESPSAGVMHGDRRLSPSI